MTAAELLERVEACATPAVVGHARRGQLSAGELERWLVESGFARSGDGRRLTATPLGLQVAGALGEAGL